MMNNKLILLFSMMLLGLVQASPQSVNDVTLLKDPITGKWGYASNDQNRKSPFRGMRKLGRRLLGKSLGSSLIGKSDADEIDWVVPPQYDAASKEFSEQLAAVEINGKVGYIDIHNRFIIEPAFAPRDHMQGFSYGLSAVRVGDRYGFIDKSGTLCIDTLFDYAENFKDNMLASVKQDGKYGAIDITGTLLVPCKFPLEVAMTSTPILNKDYRKAAKDVKARREALEFHSVTERLDALTIEVGRRINDTTWVEPLSVHSEGTGRYPGLSDQHGRCIVPAGFQSIEPDEHHHLYVVRDTLGLYGVYTYNGSRLFRPLFDSMTPFDDGYSVITVDTLAGWIDSQGGLDPVFLDEICNAGLAYDQAGDTHKASMLYHRILRIDPNHVMALNNLAIIDLNNKDYNQGMRKLKLAHKLAPDNELIDQNLHQAKKNRNERRWNRITSALEIAAVVVGVAATTYATVSGAQGMTAGTASSFSSPSYGGGSGGTGSKSGGKGEKITCVSCKGTTQCRFCNGTGYDRHTKSGKCHICHGRGICKSCHGRGYV